jgi:hypothetical protein
MLPPSSGHHPETLVNFYQTTWHYKPEDSHLQRTALSDKNLNRVDFHWSDEK